MREKHRERERVNVERESGAEWVLLPNLCDAHKEKGLFANCLSET